MARISRLEIQNYRSIQGPLTVEFPVESPVILFGENNAGKSNILRAIELVLGPFWPGTHDPEDHEFFARERDRRIEITVHFDAADRFGRYEQVQWAYDRAEDPPVSFGGLPAPFGRAIGYVKNEDRDSCFCVLVSAERKLEYQLSYSSKWTFLSRLMHRFHASLADTTAVRDRLAALFAEIKTEFRRIPAFATFVDGLQADFAGLTSSMTHSLEVDFEAYNPVNFFHALRLQASESGTPRILEEMGTGEQQVLTLAFAHAYARAFHSGVFLAIEEPEAHLHPLARQYLATKLHAMARGGVQLVLTTHEAAFLQLDAFDGFVHVTKGISGTKAVQRSRSALAAYCVSRGAPRATQANVLPFYSAIATHDILDGFFGKVVVLVEGPTEALTIPIFLARVGLDVTKQGIAITPVQGKGNLAKWWRLFTCFGIPCYLIFDNDGAADDADGSRRRDALRTIGRDSEWVEEGLRTAPCVVDEWGTVFRKNYEESLRVLFPGYSALEGAARAEGAEGKPFVARWSVLRLESSPDEGWLVFQDIKARLERLLPEG